MKSPKQLLELLERAQPLAGLRGRRWPSAATLNIILLGRQAMTALNQDFLGHEGATDVITFDLRPESGTPAGAGDAIAEIYVCPEVAIAAAARLGLPASRELVLYIVHGMLHLAGYDDLVPADAAKMRKAEARVLQALAAEADLDGFL